MASARDRRSQDVGTKKSLVEIHCVVLEHFDLVAGVWPWLLDDSVCVVD